MAHADQIVGFVFDDVAKIASTRSGKCAKWQRAFINIRHDFTVLEIEHQFELFFKRNAARNRAFDEDTDQAFCAGFGDEAMCLGALHAQYFRHFALGFSPGEMQPSCTGGQGGFLVNR